MGFLRRLFGGNKNASNSPPMSAPRKHGDDELLPTDIKVECPHIDLGPHWDNAADVGHLDKATGYQCGGCLRIFTVEEAQALRETEAERLAWMKEGDQSTVATASGLPAAAQPEGESPPSDQ